MAKHNNNITTFSTLSLENRKFMMKIFMSVAKKDLVSIKIIVDKSMKDKGNFMYKANLWILEFYYRMNESQIIYYSIPCFNYVVKYIFGHAESATRLKEL